ncbi:uncharacterized protein LOC142541755 isoform X2 [Primulina tabacum]|uniref:uncharacterized protein LOC142541755 isoform X2 n=1 Tax=Primulina tabacum TaxID=48773 RepID=UPI003F599B10
MNESRECARSARNQLLPQAHRFATYRGRTADPAVHSVVSEEVGATEAIRDEKLRHLPENEPRKENDTYTRPKSPIESSPKLEHPAVGPRKEPIVQQTRRSSNSATTLPLDDVSCAGVDGSPWPAENRKADGELQMDDAVDDDREYFKNRKASPLSEIEFADTRKPITRATVGGTQSSFSIGYERDEVVMWRPEQLDTAEDSLYRAVHIFRQNAAEGDPDSPHGRVLRALLGHT